MDACDADDLGHLAHAVALHTQAARRGYSLSQINLGNLLDDRASSGERDKAIYWYRCAVKAGDASAANNLAMHYHRAGHHSLFISWLRRAQLMGEEDAGESLRYGAERWMRRYFPRAAIGWRSGGRRR